MEKIIMLGNGCAMVTKCYNTCFAILDSDEYFLVDTGGGNTILSNLEKKNIEISKIHNVFISHAHNDHIMGIVWIIRAVCQKIIDGKYEDNLYIYSHNKNIEIIKTISNLLLQNKFTKYIGDRVKFVPIEDESYMEVLNWKVEFFDIKSTKLLQFGFKINFNSGKNLVFLGDEPLNEDLTNYAYKCDYLMHEAFCLYSQREKFKPYEKHHSTVKDACTNASKLEVKNVVLIHTEDENLDNRKVLYSEEGKNYFNGNIIVPDDLEEIYL
ncbi:MULTISPECIES: MBL fold metallo-hydrolase [Clostridium]|uniref:MBL fold metallo-hydrolase n=1 Tax=Clostridium TaxID=1485 RepID=UPI00069D83E1|nr:MULTISPECIES: MBL fold metallo-hydrolase [Clostridium]KOF55637.1 beta-lactamase [Clostridium sp. DMHC 10]MCD2349005.1 MBL fold metallo-hydrolase [Clostridium guangxiense]